MAAKKYWQVQVEMPGRDPHLSPVQDSWMFAWAEAHPFVQGGTHTVTIALVDKDGNHQADVLRFNPKGLE